MATETTKKSGFKDTVNKGYQKTKDYARKKTEQVKSYGKKYKSDVKTAYEIGYSRGWEDAYDVPKRFGAKTAAAYGYKKGIKNRRKSDKYQGQYKSRSKSD